MLHETVIQICLDNIASFVTVPESFEENVAKPVYVTPWSAVLEKLVCY